MSRAHRIVPPAGRATRAPGLPIVAAESRDAAVMDFSVVRVRWADDLPARPDAAVRRERVVPVEDRADDRRIQPRA